MVIDKDTKQLAELVYNEGEIIERNAFMLGNQHKVSYVMSYNGYLKLSLPLRPTL